MPGSCSPSSAMAQQREHGHDTEVLGEITSSTFTPQVFPATSGICSRQLVLLLSEKRSIGTVINTSWNAHGIQRRQQKFIVKASTFIPMKVILLCFDSWTSAAEFLAVEANDWGRCCHSLCVSKSCFASTSVVSGNSSNPPPFCYCQGHDAAKHYKQNSWCVDNEPTFVRGRQAQCLRRCRRWGNGACLLLIRKIRLNQTTSFRETCFCAASRVWSPASPCGTAPFIDSGSVNGE